ncbi:hypothetical protein [Fibrobacter sp. UWH4]|uniref:hypothetical protein n=1 Tax=Fibrobacter sp. UWH4 TaxID=1896210 RepID=UPI0009130E8E|nr:hypothetical protein [Fibrobacter sp. UWH4]SHK18505.1 hypothetical protein SAMN05720762_10113 [Fibrobacter sp. UWH4]
MKRTTEILVATVLFLVGAVWAGIKPIGYRCDVPLPNNDYTAECYVKQFEPGESAGEDYEVYDTWDEFASDFLSRVGAFESDPNTWSVQIKFENDIDLGGYSKKNGTCAESFTPLHFNLSGKPVSVDGNDKTISGFCYVSDDQNAAFFSELSNASVKNLTFDSAYVMAKTVSSALPKNAAVVAVLIENSSFSGVTVKNSTVYGWNTSAIVYSATGGAKFSSVQVENVHLSVSEESLKDVSQIGSLLTRVSYSAGLVAYLVDYASFKDISVSNLQIPDSVSQVLKNKGMVYSGASYVGGIVGFASVSMDGSTSFSLEGCTVSAELTGSSVGGLVGSVSPHTITQESIFEVVNADVTFKSGDYSGANQNRYLGGLVGALSWRNGSVQLLKNKVETTIKNTKTVGSVGSRLGGVVGVYSGLSGGDDAVADFTINENDVAVDISSSDTALAVGGIVGYATVNATNSTFAIRNSTVKPVNPGKNPNVITATASKMYSVHAAYVVGRVDNPNYTVELRGNHAEGNIKIAASTVKTMSGVGAMAGRAYCLNLYVRYNTSIGDLSVPIANETAGTDSDFFHVGYEVGEIRAPSSAQMNVEDNYHYGFSDENAGLAVGWLGLVNGDPVTPDLWKTQAVDYYRIWKNYRNAVKTKSASLDAEGTLDVDGSGVIYVENEKKWLYDGVIDGEEMKTRLFTYVLNTASSSGGECGVNGTVCWENEPDSLPMVSTYRTVYKVTIVLDDVYDKLTEADKESVKKYLNETEQTSYLTIYTDKYFMLDHELVKLVYGLSVVCGMFEENAAAGPDMSEGTDIDLYNFSTTTDAYFRAAEISYENVRFDVNTAATEVFYGVGSELPDSLVVPNGNRPVFLPSQIYTAEACVMGWAFNADTNDYKYHVKDPGSYLYPDINAEKTLYAVWKDAESCLGHYVRVRVGESENGTVAVDEYRDGTKVYTHHFAKDSTMLLPWDNPEGVAMRLLAEPDSGYALDSLVIVKVMKDAGSEEMSNNIKDGSVERYVLQEGDTLPDGLINATLTAYFSEAKDVKNPGDSADDPTKLALVRHELLQSGNAVQLTLETNQFEVDGSASLQVSLTDALGVVLENYGFAEEVKKTPYEHVWTQYPLLPGRYVVKATLSDKAEKVSFDTAFTVSAEIAAAPDAWRMVSLSDVEIDSIVWDADPVFYHWDESAYFGDFWKYQKYRGGKVEAEQGYWYNSLEGRPLLLRRDSARTGNEIVWKLDSGWNMVANPYGWGVQLNAEQLENESLVLTVWNPESADYPGKTLYLGPYEAAWVYSESKRTAEVGQEPFFVSAAEHTPGFDYPLEKRVLAKAESRSNWTLQAVLSDTKGHRDSWNVIGAGAAAEQPEPPEGMGDHVNLSLLEGKRALAKSIRSADERYEWNMALSATGDRVGYLRFEGVKALNEMGLKVFVTVDGKTTEVVAGDSLKVLLKAAGATATVRVAPMDARALASKVENLRFEQASGRLQVGFDVSEGLAGANYMVQLVGLNGKIAASYASKAFFGHNTVALNVPKSGIYLLRVRVGSEQASRKVAISR